MTLLKLPGNFIKEIFLIFLSSLIMFFAYPFLLFILIPTCWYREVVKYYVQKDPRIGQILEGINGVFAGHDPYINPLVVLVPYYPLAGKLDIPQVIKALTENIIKPGKFPELTQKIVRKFGYHFWYSIKDSFKVEDHVRYLKPECPNMPLTREELRNLTANKLGRLPFDPNRSPWEILVVPNYIDDRDPEVRSVVIQRVSHCLMDGYSIVNFMQSCASKPWKMFGDDCLNKNQSKFEKLFECALLLCTGPYHFLKMFVFSNDRNDFVKNGCTIDNDEIWLSQCTPSVSAKRLKSVKNLHGVSMSSLITTLIAQATYNCMKSSGMPLNTNRIHGMLSFPLPGHPGTLTNHWSLVRFPVEVYENDLVKTLKFVEREFQSLRSSVKPVVFFYVNQLMSVAPLWFRPDISENGITPSTFIFTNFPGPDEPTDIFGCRCKQICLGGKTSKGVGTCKE